MGANGIESSDAEAILTFFCPGCGTAETDKMVVGTGSRNEWAGQEDNLLLSADNMKSWRAAVASDYSGISGSADNSHAAGTVGWLNMCLHYWRCSLTWPVQPAPLPPDTLMLGNKY
jgi:hypothetical protein